MSTVSFFTNEAVSLEKKVDLTENIWRTKLENIDSEYEIDKCVKWIQSNNFQKVCLQFPDHMLPDSSKVCLKLQKLVGQTLYILADTAYESCCIDYVAAAHINADAIIHFGPVCFSQTLGNIPYLNIFEKHDLNVEQFKADLKELNTSICIGIVLDTCHLHQIDKIKEILKENNQITINGINDKNDYQNMTVIFVGNDMRKLRNLAFTLSATEIYFYNERLVKYNIEAHILKKRNYLIEKIKDSKTIGIIIGTLSVKNYIEVIARMKKLIELNNKKYYLISVGKPTVAKLANFPELDVYVAVTCSMSEIYESRDFYKPIVTPYDIEMALNTNHDRVVKFSYDFNGFIDNSEICAPNTDVTDVSLLTNNVRSFGIDNPSKDAANESQIALKPDGTIASNTNFGAGYLSERTWKGLEQKLGQNEPELAKEGQSGLAQKYKNELNI